MLLNTDTEIIFQSELTPIIDELRHYLKRCLGTNLHSIYLFGSVARCTAVIGQSDINVVVVTHRDLNQQQMTLISSIKWRVANHFDVVSTLDLRLGLVANVTNFDNIFDWGFMLKQCCICIEGDDLSDCYGEFEPNWEIAKHWNMDLATSLKQHRVAIAQAQTEIEQTQAQIAIAKKLLFASHCLVMYKSKQWLDDPVLCGQTFLNYHPEYQQTIERLGILLSGRVIAKRSVVGLMDEFGTWLVKQYQRTEFRIG